ncbi:DUF1906 domain-containing protein [Catenulispora rubra]|uniref:DUF1906 domain-containing protein n=1 Tax=Catenulispora rubra TaxID=280293 RepID=UPI0018923BE7|nr:DUF1906 domain-containing protein [Catenulispora rubra]
MRLLRLIAVTAALTLSCGEAASAAVGPLSGPKEVSSAGTTVAAPVRWPVHDLSSEPHTCMRYDRHAVNLGGPGPDQNCPADEEPQTVPPAPTRLPERTIKAAATYSGLGFDTCAAPSTDAMQAWARASPYHAVGIYIGGIDRACPDGNLTPGWIQTVARQGWKFFPIYVGLQAPCWKNPGRGHPALIARSRRWTQGQEAANDAANRAAYFGIAPGSPIYFDMEYYPRNDAGCTQDVQAFLSAWTDQLHARGFISGVYSSSKGAIADMALVYESGAAYRADVAWFAHWDKVPQLFGDATLSNRYWPGPQRIKQYRGGHNETYGGKRLNIDLNVLDAPVAALK